jgi:hypothetical protein
MSKHIDPLWAAQSFNCPHCGAQAHQIWYNLYAKQINGNFPQIPDGSTKDNIISSKINSHKLVCNEEIVLKINGTIHQAYLANNLWLSQCYSCRKIVIWNHKNILYPTVKYICKPNEDLDEDIKRDFNEAMDILVLSPRGSSALLRLCIQKLCKQLGQKGENIYEDIASLVKKGLDPRIQQALDIVRVVGNSAVHPRMMDLTDDRETAQNLFKLINLIADVMISQPKHVDNLYKGLPETARKQIVKRDA